jgi:hypothetical protein
VPQQMCHSSYERMVGSGDGLGLGGGTVGNTRDQDGCAITTTNTVHNWEWLWHDGPLQRQRLTTMNGCATRTLPIVVAF